MNIKPLADNVVIKATEAEETTKSGIVLTSSAKEKPQVAVVVAVGPGGTVDGKEVTIAGRLMSKRVMGKASFCNVQDLQGSIQSYVARDVIGEEEYADFKKLDIGDIVGITGTVFRTKTGETSIHAEKVTLLSKSLQILPEKFHGLTNTDTRYRQRYTDLIMNP